ncbi:NADH-quinone oxidoreductase subunit J [Alicyclobacillus cycloheptanicus]|uniref:NADH-quinone oxidoreductase subunit J n=1 Tax=Alicyclobacillus cycloheptanicus TaxID=1457 RepID=A0ABT9XGI2_9BACL|nr:NADH-quinone oxidoreductase subunit J [Alicyclobacillus cycloheptanicus]MDQ0189411.1 NADH:ubiquinone oxidoreductase subunit 6 (subunit J) [Alicyclobacillus cycloheptanicus]WDM02284.1 NADH-quinone oxidoreductase subunit J [Alicyclobacillus cycloheptanicus]
MSFTWNLPTIAFFLIALAILGCAIMMLSFRKVVYMALSIGGVFIGCSAIYFLLGAEFIGIAQVAIYAGAITILILFAIMLTNHEAMEPPTHWNLRNVGAAVGAILLAATLFFTIRSVSWPAEQAVDVNQGNSNAVAVGLAIFKQYTVPFELVSLLLIVALVGAVILAQERKEDE